jgi:microcystin-dependent protein
LFSIIGNAFFAGPFAPKAWRYCAGESLAIAQNEVLYVVIGTKFGGDGASTFALPSLADPAPGVKYIVCVEGTYPQRAA